MHAQSKIVMFTTAGVLGLVTTTLFIAQHAAPFGIIMGLVLMLWSGAQIYLTCKEKNKAKDDAEQA